MTGLLMEEYQPAAAALERQSRNVVSKEQLLRLLINLTSLTQDYRLELQLWEGCGSLNCPKLVCASHSHRNEQRPQRGFSRLSARAAAFYIASLTNAESFLCPSVVTKFLPTDRSDIQGIESIISRVQNNLNAQPLPEAQRPNDHIQSTEIPPTDPKSFPQQLLTSQYVLRFLGPRHDVDVEEDGCSFSSMKTPNGQVLVDAEARLTQDLQLYRRTGESTFAVSALLKAMNALLDHCESGLASYDIPDREEGASAATESLAVALTIAIGNLSSSSQKNDLRAIKAFWRSRYVKRSLSLWIQRVFSRYWDGKPIIHTGSVAGKALTALAVLNGEFDYRRVLAQYRVGQMLLTPKDLAQATLRLTNDAKLAKEHFCLAHHPWACPEHLQLQVFRRICYERLNEAIDTAKTHMRMLYKCFLPFIIDGTPPPHVSSLRELRLRKALSYYLTIQVRREHLLPDAFDDLWRRQQRELLRPIRVAIVNKGEQGVDQGGIAQEFFRLATIEALKPVYGMFTIDERSRIAWFNPTSPEPLYKYELLGVLIALAVHNGFSVPVLFPKVLYRKLLGVPSTKQYGSNKFGTKLMQIEDGWPELERGLRELRDWRDGDVADVFVRTFTFTIDDFGRKVHFDMTKKAPALPISELGAEFETSDAPMVTNRNRWDYINCYIDYLTTVTVAPQYNAFARGFYTILPPEVIGTVTPDVLKLLVEGPAKDVDTHELQRTASYSNGYHGKDPYISMFWDIVHRLPKARQKQLLEFTTASDRIPINGVGSLGFVIQKHGSGEDEERLPTSVTCYSRLLLPEYRSREVLKRKLNVALDNAQGFGLS